MVITWRQAGWRTHLGNVLNKHWLIEWMYKKVPVIFKTYITKTEPFREKLRYHHMVNQKSCQTETFKTHRCVPIILTICYFITWINELKCINMLCIHLYKLTLNWNEYWQAEIWQKSISNYLECWIKYNLKRNKILI